MQSRSGGVGAFDVDNTSRLCAEVAFCDFGAVTDPPSADVTAHVLETLALEAAGRAAATAALEWLLARQEADGSWFGRWGANYVYGTGAVVPGARRRGRRATRSCDARRPARALLEHQNADGGCGEDLRSYRDRAGADVASRPPRRPPGRCSACTPPATRAASRRGEASLPGRDPARRRRLGRALLHRHRASRATSTSTTTSTGSSSR